MTLESKIINILTEGDVVDKDVFQRKLDAKRAKEHPSKQDTSRTTKEKAVEVYNMLENYIIETLGESPTHEEGNIMLRMVFGTLKYYESGREDYTLKEWIDHILDKARG